MSAAVIIWLNPTHYIVHHDIFYQKVTQIFIYHTVSMIDTHRTRIGGREYAD